MSLISDLIIEHRALEAQAEQLLAVTSAPVPDPAAVAAMRWRFAQLLFDHCAREDRAIYDRLMASGDSAATVVAWHYRQEHGALGSDFARYIADWPVGRIAEEWGRFGAETREILQKLADRAEREESVLFVHAERVMFRCAA